MTLLVVFVALLGQDSLPERVDRCLKEALAGTSSRTFLKSGAALLRGLGEDAIPAMAERLAEEVCKGTWSDRTDLLLLALIDRPEATTPLQTALRDASLPVDVRVNLAVSLSYLNDRFSWRREMLGVVRNEFLSMKTRMRAARIFPVEDGDLRQEFRIILSRLSFCSLSDQKTAVEFISTEGNWMPDLMGGLMRDRRLSPDLRLYSIECRLRAGDGSHYPAMFEVLDEIRAGKSKAAPAAEALATKLADKRPVVDEPPPVDLRPLYYFALGTGLVAACVLFGMFRKANA